MSEQYLITTKKIERDDANSTEQHDAQNISSKRFAIEGSYPKKQLINIMLSEADKLEKIIKIEIYNKRAFCQKEFFNTNEFVSWLKNITMSKICDFWFSFSNSSSYKETGSTVVNFYIEKYKNVVSKTEPKLLTLEIRDYFDCKLILTDDYTNFKDLENYVTSLIDPSHKKFSPSNPCVNRDCRFYVNECDITDYFLGSNRFKLNHYKSNGIQTLEYTELRPLYITTIQHVLAIDANQMPTLVYSCVREELGNTTRERGVFEGEEWKKTFDNTATKSKYPSYDGLVADLYTCAYQNDVYTFTNLLAQYEGEYPTNSFVTIEMTSHYGECMFYSKEFELTNDGYVIYAQNNSFNSLIPPHYKWNYDDFDVIL